MSPSLRLNSEAAQPFDQRKELQPGVEKGLDHTAGANARIRMTVFGSLKSLKTWLHPSTGSG
jgi:hypothetical protein